MLHKPWTCFNLSFTSGFVRLNLIEIEYFFIIQKLFSTKLVGHKGAFRGYIEIHFFTFKNFWKLQFSRGLHFNVKKHLTFGLHFFLNELNNP